MLLAAAALLVTAYFLPLWNLTMFAPQYPDGLRLDIYRYTLVGGNNGQDVKEINVLNHYIGMRISSNEAFTEFKWMPFVIGALGLLLPAGRRARHGRGAGRRDGAVRVLRRASRSGRSATSCTATATTWRRRRPCKVPPFMPPMFGYQQIANFEVYSYPRAASYAMAAVVMLLADRAHLDVVATAGEPRAARQRRVHHDGHRRCSSQLCSRRRRQTRCPPQAGLEGRPARVRSIAGPGARRSRRRPGDRVVGRGRNLRRRSRHRSTDHAGRTRPARASSGPATAASIRVRAADVTIDGFDIDGRGGGDLGRDTSGIHVAAPRVTIRRLPRPRSPVRHLPSRGRRRRRRATTSSRAFPAVRPVRAAAAFTSGTASAFASPATRSRARATASTSSRLRTAKCASNRATDLRYGLHYMFSDDNVFEDNVFENGAAGAALMYSNRMQFRRNRFVRNRGFASVGLLLKACDDVVAEDNLIADNARGIFLEGSNRNRFTRNIVAMSDMALVVYDSSGANVFEGNTFIGNLTPLSLSGRRTDTRFDGNYWSDHREPDLDGDGVADRPYRLSNVFDHLRGNLTAADLFAHSTAAAALGAAERAFPVLDPVPVVDRASAGTTPTSAGRADRIHALEVPHRRERRPARASPAPGLRPARGGRAFAAVGAEDCRDRRTRRSPSATASGRVVDRLTLEVPPGSVVALLGPNGSGKTTSIKAAAGLIRPDAGDGHIGSRTAECARRRERGGRARSCRSACRFPRR